MQPNNSASGRNSGRTSLSQRLDAITEAMWDISAAVRENTHAHFGDPEDDGRPYTVYVTVDRSDEMERYTVWYAAERDLDLKEVVREARETVLLGHEDRVPGFSDSTSYEVSDSDVRIQHVLTIDGDGYPVLLDPGEYS